MNATIDETLRAETAPRKRGRPRKFPELREDAVSVAPHQSTVRGRATAIGRDGKVVTRKLTGQVDKYDLKAMGIKSPEGWSYEWKRKTIAGMEDIDHLNALSDNGWTSVPADRHTGTAGRSRTGEIVRDGLILMERPVELTMEARAEEKYAARAQMQAQNDQYRGRMPSGMSTAHPGVQPNIRGSYEQAPAELQPSYQLSQD